MGLQVKHIIVTLTSKLMSTIFSMYFQSKHNNVSIGSIFTLSSFEFNIPSGWTTG